jgi:CHRD domain-containing protein
MRRSRLVAVAATVVGVAGFTAAATVAGDQKRDFETDMIGYEEVPAVSTEGNGQVDVEVARDGESLKFVLHYRAIESPVTQSHIHFGQKDVNGGIVVFFCSNLGNGPAGTPPCPQPAPGEMAEVTGTRTAADVTGGAAAQGIAAGEFAELVRALRAGVAYANVHSQLRPGGEIRGQFDRRGHQDD